jgi:hypothetical protein
VKSKLTLGLRLKLSSSIVNAINSLPREELMSLIGLSLDTRSLPSSRLKVPVVDLSQVRLESLEDCNNGDILLWFSGPSPK